jgi:trimeric autotransporter adhesin
MNKRAGRSNLRAKYIAVAVTAAFTPWSVYGQTPPPNQMPNVTVTNGVAIIHTPSGTFQQIDQATLRAIYQGSMTMGSNAHLHLQHAIHGSSGIGLFKDVSGSLSQIFGRITSNGQVFISNPNGVLFGSTARVEVGGLFATSLSITDGDFMSGRYSWFNAGSAGGVTNQGEIITPTGYTVLAGPQVRNDGLIVARTGTVTLAAGDRVTLDMVGDGLISVSVDQAALNASAVNAGVIEADGGTVTLTARSANALLDTVVNAGGVIRANSLIERNGEIVLDGGGAGLVNVAGRLEAGSATVSGAAVTLNGTVTTGPGSQTITTPGALTIEAGAGGDAGLFHNGSGEQRITAGSLVMRGGTGTDSRAIITSSDAAADQNITVAGDVTMTGGSAGSGNLAIIRAFGDQTIDAGSLTATIGAGGVGNAAVIVAPRQTITTSGDVRLNGGGATGNVAARIGGLSVASAGVDTPADLQLNVGNDLVLAGGPGPVNQALIGGAAGQPQNIRIQTGRDVVLGATGNSVARIGNGPVPTPGDVTIHAGRDVQVNGSGEILSGGTMTVTAGRAINVNATSPSAFTARISSTNGQTIEAQSITVTAQNGRLAQIANSAIGDQRITTTGNVEIQTLGPVGGTAEIRNGIGLQTLTVGGEQLTLRAMGGGTAGIASSGDQTVNMTAGGPKSITIGDHAAQGTSTISSGGDQRILGYADITLTGGSGPAANGSNATIFASNPTRTQRIEARNLSLANSIFGGNNSFAGIQGAHQSIHALGNVTLTANASGGTLPGVRIGGLSGTGATATDLLLTVGGDLVLTASNTTANNGVGIGSTAAPGPAFANHITIDAGGSVILNGGTTEGSGARIGSSASTGAAPGDISITAGGAIVLNGGTTTAVIRTQGDVALEAASISQGTNGLVEANTLTTTTSGNTSLTGSNQVNRFRGTASGPGSSVTLVDGGTLQVQGVSTNNGAISLTTDSLTNTGVITNGGGINASVVLIADAYNLAGGSVQAGNSTVQLRPRTGTNSFGIEAAGQTTVTNADIASIQTSDFLIFGSSTGNNFTGGMTIGENARVEAGSKNLAFSRSLTPSPEMVTIGSQGVTTTGDIIIGAGGGGIRSNGGTITGDEVQLRATNGIGTPGARVKTAANALAFTNAGGSGVFVSELDNVTLRTISLSAAGGIITSTNILSGSLDLVTGGDLTVAGLVSSTAPMTVNAGGRLHLDGTSGVDAVLLSSGGQTISAQSIDLVAQGRRANIENVNGSQSVTARTGGMNLQVPSGSGVAQIINTSNVVPGNQTVEVAGEVNILGGAVAPSTNSGIFKNGPGGLQTVRATGITLQGASTGTNAGAGIRSQGDQLVEVSGDINMRGGNGGTNNNAFLSANPTTPGVVGNQTIRARDINMSNGTGGVDTTSTITAGKQLIEASGNVTLTAEGALVGTAAGGPGVRIGAPGGTPLATDLTLLVGGNLVLNGGSAVDNAASIGSSGAGVPPAPNTIRIEAGGDVIMNAGNLSGTGVRIGSGSSGTAGGSISIKAGRSIQMNGSAQRDAVIRTLGNVTLDAASIMQGGNGRVQANLLTVNTTGTANLAGPNDVASFNATSGGPLTFVDAGGLQVTGVSTTNDTITLTTDSLTNSGVITNGGGTSTANIVLNADSFNLAGGTVEGGAAAVILRPRTGTNSFGIEAAGQTTLTNADIASIHTTDFVVFGSGMGTTFTGNMTIGENARVEGGGKHLAFFRSSAPGGTTTIGSQGVATTGNVIVSAGGGAIVSNGGTVAGDQVQLRASQGIGSAAARVQTAASRLAVNTGGPGAFVSELNGVTLGNVNLTVGGIANNVTNTINGGGSYDLSGGSITISDLLQAGTVTLSTGGSITEVGAGAIAANTLSTSSGFDTQLLGDNRVAVFSGFTSSGDLSLANTGALDVQLLQGMGDVRLINAGTLTASGFMSAAGAMDVTTTGPGSDFIVRSTVGSTGPMTLDVAGRLQLSANGAQGANVNGHSQTIRAQSVELMSQNGGSASLSNQSGDQRITVTGGSIDVQVLNGFGFAQISNAAPGSRQTIRVTDGDHINVNGRGGFALVTSTPSGTQDISITGSGANAITLGSQGALGSSQIAGGMHQIVTAGAAGENGSITIVGPDANSRLAGFVSNPVANGTQTISTSGTLRVTGGRANQASNFQSGVFHNGSGAQTVNAARIELEGGSSGVNNGAFIASGGGGNPANAGAQTVNATGDIVITGGAGGNASISGPSTRLQTIRAHNISMTNTAAGGFNTGAFISGGHQEIYAAGNVTLTARAGGGDLPGVRIGGGTGVATDLKLHVGGDLTLTAGAQNNGVGIGSSSTGTPLANDIYIEAGGSVILNASTATNAGVRIGSSSLNGTAGGNIEIHAGGGIELNGTSQSGAVIRTLGNVTLDAASVSQTGNGFVLADTLTTTTTGATNLAGPNDVARLSATSGGPLTFVDAGGLRVTGVSTTNDTITLTTDSLVNEGVITNGGGASTANIVLNADAFNLAGGTVEGGGAAVVLRPRTGTNSFGIEAAGQTTLTNADIASIHTSDFVVFGSGIGTTFTGNMTIGENARVEGGGKNLAFFRSSAPGGTTTIGSWGVSTTGNVIVSAGGGAIVSNGGVVAGDQVQLRASHGIGSALASVLTNANRLAVNTGGPGAFVSELNDVTLGNVNLTVGGIANNVSNTINGGGSYDLTADGSIAVSDLLQAGTVSLRALGGSLTEVGAGAIVANTLTTSSSLDTVLTGANQVSAMNASSGGDIVFTNSGDLTFAGTASGDIAVTNAGNLTVTSLFATTADFDNQGAMTVNGFWSTQGSTSITTTTIGAGADLTVTSTLMSGGPTVLDIDGTLRVAAGGTQNAFLQSSGGQDITARAVEVSARDGRTAQIVNFAGDQTVTATSGGVDVQSTGPGSLAFIHNLGAQQTVNAIGGIRLLSQAGGGAQIGNFGAGAQSIAVSGGNGIDLQANGINAAIVQGAQGLSQTILVTDADHISLNGVNGGASITANRGTQTVSITGSGANAITLGSAGAIGSSQIVGGSTQNVTAGAEGQSGSITIIGSDANGRFAGVSSQTAADGTQSVSTSGVLRVTGGNASAQNLNAGLFHAGSGEQTVNAARIELEGGAAGNGNGALIVSNGGNVPANAGAQTINVSGDLIIAGGAGGSAGITGPATRLQTIRAANLHMTNSAAGGNNSVGFILGGHQDIGVTGDLTMTARASGGDLPGVRIGGLAGTGATATDLTLTVGGDLILTGGTAVNNGVGIGSTAAPGPAFRNDITIDVGGNVILNSGSLAGTGTRIGSSAATGAGEGDIRITAGGDLRLNGVDQGAAIRTLGSVTLDAASITEASRGIIEAGTLTTRTDGDTLLGGANRVSAFTAASDHGNVHLTNGAPVLTLGAMDLPGNLAVVQTGDLAVGSASATQATTVAAAGDVSMSATGQILVRGSDTTAGAGAAVLAGGDLSFSAGDVSLVAGNAALTPVFVRGADGVQMTVDNELRVTGGGGLLSPTLLTSGGDIDLTIGQALRVNAGAGLLSIARVQLETRGGVIRLTFPELSHGGYFVNGIEGRTHQGQTGFFSVLRPARVGRTLLLDYGT